MNEDLLKLYLLVFIPIFIAVDSLGLVPIFVSLTSDLSKKDRTKLIWTSTFTALFIAIAFLFVGRLLFQFLGITMSDFMVAGGIILFIIAIRDLLSQGHGGQIPGQTMGVVPLAVPLIVGPAVLTISLVLLNSFGIILTLFSLVANIFLCGLILHCASWLLKFLGQTGTHILSKIFSLLLGAIGIMLIRRGIESILTVWTGA